MEKIEWNLWMSNGTGAQIFTDDNDRLVATITGEHDANTMLAFGFVLEVAKALLQGQEINRYFKPIEPNPDALEIVRCQWLRSGKLRCFGLATKKHRHAESVDQAIMRHRVFTCTRDLYDRLPKQRAAEKQFYARRIRNAKPQANQADDEPGQNPVHHSGGPQ